MDRQRALAAIKEITDATQKEMDQLLRDRTRGRAEVDMAEIEPEITASFNSQLLKIYTAGYLARQRDEQIENATKLPSKA